MSIQATKRLQKEYKQLKQTPVQFIEARPNDENILDWHYVLTGPPDTPYENGQYHGRVTFPPEYPFKPPRIKMSTPSGRFEVNKRLCLSMSDFHEESWNPSWSVATILTGLLSFMTGVEATTGSITTSESTKRKLAKESRRFNCDSNPMFRQIFPELYRENLKYLSEASNSDKATAASSTSKAAAEKPETAPIPDKIEVDLEELDEEDRIRALKIKDKLPKQGDGEPGSPMFKLSCLILAIIAVLYNFLL